MSYHKNTEILNKENPSHFSLPAKQDNSSQDTRS